jgi:ATP adenylyltransferase
VSLEHLWAGWRSAYVSGATSTAPGTPDRPAGRPEDPHDGSACVFCRIADSGGPSVDNGVLWVGRASLVVLNAYPYASGHLMAVPRRHVGALGDLTHDEVLEVWEGLRLGVAAIEAAYRPEGINLGANLGQAAGAGIPRHLHLHAVPRWMGDTNFMTAVADTRVLPETLASSWERLTASWPGQGSGPSA